MRGKLTERIAGGLRKAANGIEEFSLQASLGKLEAREVFEKVKRRYRSLLHETELRFNKAKDITEETYRKLRTALEELNVQLALGKAETRDLFNEQRRKIRHAIHRVQLVLKKNEVPPRYSQRMNTELTKLKIKLDILKLKYHVNEFSDRPVLIPVRNDFANKLNELRNKVKRASHKPKSKIKNFKDEINEAWVHMKKAFVTEEENEIG